MAQAPPFASLHFRMAVVRALAPHGRAKHPSLPVASGWEARWSQSPGPLGSETWAVLMLNSDSEMEDIYI